MGEQQKGQVEQYSQSLRLLRRLGRLAIGNQLHAVEARQVATEALVDFTTAIGENLSTDTELGPMLMFNHVRMHDIVDGHVVDATGRPIVEMVQAGVDRSDELRAQDSRFETQYQRDMGDALMAHHVDELNVGEMHAALSMDPVEAMARDGVEFWQKNMHYQQGMAVLMVAYRLSDTVMLQGTYAVKKSQKVAIAQLLQQHGSTVSSSTPADEFIRHGVTSTADQQTFLQFGDKFQRAYQEIIHDTTTMRSTTEIIDQNMSFIQQAFTELMQPLAHSVASGRLERNVAGYVQAVLAQANGISSELREKLTGLQAGSACTDDQARSIEQLIRYGVVEQMRARLKQELYLEKNQPITSVTQNIPRSVVVAAIQQTQYYGGPVAGQLVAGVVTGTNAGRDYNGCAGSQVAGGRFDASPDRVAEQATVAEDTKEGIGTVHEGYCRIPGCPTGGKRVEVGGCDICLGECQPLFDLGLNSKQIEDLYARRSSRDTKRTPSAMETFIQSIAVSAQEPPRRELASSNK